MRMEQHIQSRIFKLIKIYTVWRKQIVIISSPLPLNTRTGSHPTKLLGSRFRTDPNKTFLQTKHHSFMEFATRCADSPGLDSIERKFGKLNGG